jgi:hypothetical protein
MPASVLRVRTSNFACVRSYLVGSISMSGWVGPAACGGDDDGERQRGEAHGGAAAHYHSRQGGAAVLLFEGAAAKVRTRRMVVPTRRQCSVHVSLLASTSTYFLLRHRVKAKGDSRISCHSAGNFYCLHRYRWGPLPLYCTGGFYCTGLGQHPLFSNSKSVKPNKDCGPRVPSRCGAPVTIL